MKVPVDEDLSALDDTARLAYGQRLTMARRDRGWSQRELSGRLSVGAWDVAAIERGVLLPSLRTMREIATLFERDDTEAGTTVMCVLLGDGDDVPPVSALRDWLFLILLVMGTFLFIGLLIACAFLVKWGLA